MNKSEIESLWRALCATTCKMNTPKEPVIITTVIQGKRNGWK